jgi:hypothetical protein
MMGGIPSRLWRRKSETLLAQNINNKELMPHFILSVFSNKIDSAYVTKKWQYINDLMKIGYRICAGTCNVAGRTPPNGLNLIDHDP